ncbi:MAG: hypothetical protein KJ069_13755 [Anaerolineae bacterium]|nr:hypothetical protein [Anaerolineae bacterium]
MFSSSYTQETAVTIPGDGRFPFSAVSLFPYSFSESFTVFFIGKRPCPVIMPCVSAYKE